MLRRMRVLRIVCVLAVAALAAACAPEPTASELTTKGITNLKSSKTAHLEGTGSLALQAEQGFSFSFDFKLTGDAELPDRARMTVQMAMFGMKFDVETIAMGGKEYTKDSASGTWSEGSGTSPVNTVMDPLGNMDPSLIRDIVEVDRPEVDGKKTRHLRYQADAAKMLADMRTTAGTTPQSFSNPQATGELWIRIDDAQIVRQLVKVTLDVDGLTGFDLMPGAAGVGKASMEMSLDMRFSRHGEPIPQITAPPVGP